MYGYFYDNNYVYMVYEVANSGNLFELIKSGYKFTEKIFPRNNTEYGYNCLLNQMINMYNQTM